MRKVLTLDAEALRVESFPTADAPERALLAATPLCVQTLPVNDCLTHDTFQNC